MKKQLLTIILAFIAISCFAAKPNKTELLTHLKQIKIELENELRNLSMEENKLKQEWNYYIVLTKVWNDIADLPENSRRRKILANFYFDQICNHKKTISELTEMSEEIQTTLFVNDSLYYMANDKEQEKEEKILLSIIKKYRKYDPHQNDPLEIEDIEGEESLIVGMAIDRKKMAHIVLKKVKDKIKKLER